MPVSRLHDWANLKKKLHLLEGQPQVPPVSLLFLRLPSAKCRWEVLLCCLLPPSCACCPQPGGESVVQRFEKFIFLGDDRSVKEVWVDGRQVK